MKEDISAIDLGDLPATEVFLKPARKQVAKADRHIIDLGRVVVAALDDDTYSSEEVGSDDPNHPDT